MSKDSKNEAPVQWTEEHVRNALRTCNKATLELFQKQTDSVALSSKLLSEARVMRICLVHCLYHIRVHIGKLKRNLIPVWLRSGKSDNDSLKSDDFCG